VGAGSQKLRITADNPPRSNTVARLEPYSSINHQSSNQSDENDLQHDALQNFSQRDRFSISVLLKDQYSSSRPDHPPGKEDPLESAANLNYEDKTLSK
jgi:hypothetical protein